MLERAEQLRRALKKARARANEVDVPKDTQKVGKTIFSFVLGV
jgi:hypothetical protein